MGASAGYFNLANDNTFIGVSSGYNNSTGGENVFVGKNSGLSNNTGTRITLLGYNSNVTNGLTNATAIGYSASVTANNSLVLGGTGTNSVKVGIGVTAPAAELEVNGYTKLGSTAPKVKMISLTGTTDAAQGGSVNILHGLNSAKILSVSVLVEYLSNRLVPPSHVFSAGYQYDFNVDALGITVFNSTANSSNILSKPVKILITYEE
jgi:hypothetical protein